MQSVKIKEIIADALSEFRHELIIPSFLTKIIRKVCSIFEQKVNEREVSFYNILVPENDTKQFFVAYTQGFDLHVISIIIRDTEIYILDIR